MLRIVTGPFHPDLERALLEDLSSFKANEPLAACAILVPSTHLAIRLRTLLVLESYRCLLNVPILTFHQFALRLCAEAYGLGEDGAVRLPLTLVDDLFGEHLLRKIGERPLPALDALHLHGRVPGTWAALWSSLRDLKDAQVPPERAIEALDEGLFDAEDAPQLRALFALYGGLLEFMRDAKVGTVEDLATAVVPLVAGSAFLSSLRMVAYYGFYELTQVQLSLFEAVVRTVEATLYFPLYEAPGDGFARRFYERCLLPLAGIPRPVSAAPTGPPADRTGRRPRPRMINAVGVEGELNFVCREILDLVETNGYAFSEIGIVARTLEPYRDRLKPLFDRHCIPFVSTAGRPILHEPVTKVVLQLAELPLTAFYRPAVLDVVGSPFYRLPPGLGTTVEPRPDLWRLAAGLLGITRGEEEWKRLERFDGIGAGLPGGEYGEHVDELQHPAVDAAQCRLLWVAVSRMITACRALPERGSPAALTDAFLDLVSGHLVVPGLTEALDGRSEATVGEAFIGATIKAATDCVRSLEDVGLEMRWEDWVQTFARVLERTSLPIEEDRHPGVRVLDAMAARGLPFRALFLLGLNEKTFPRVIREDPFLRDQHRRVLDATLGYRINEKLAGYDEEVLLFGLLCGSAHDRLYWLYQRADAEGRSLAPSPFLAEGGTQDGRQVETVPRRLVERVARPPFVPALVPRQDLALWLALRGADPSPLLPGLRQEPLLFQRGVAALALLEREGSDLGSHDGVTGPLDAHWAGLARRGLAPTPLERYARCPFQYFAQDVLRLEAVRVPVTGQIEAQSLGTLCHEVLKRTYEGLMAKGWPETTSDAWLVGQCVASAVEEAFRRHAAREGTGLALLWEITRETVIELVTALIEAEREDFLTSGFRPVAMEAEIQGTLAGLALPGWSPLPLRGRADRVDRRINPPAVPTLRMVDYKYKQGREKKPEDKNLATAALRGFRLQPPLYARMTLPGEALPVQVDFRFLAPRWDPPIDSASFDAATWEGPVGRQIAATLGALLDGIRAGRYFILPDTYCDFCNFAPACRRLHGPTGARARRSAPARALRLLRKQRPVDA